MSGLFGTNMGSQSPTIESFRVQRSMYGVPIRLIYGKVRTAYNLVWRGNQNAVPQSESYGGGGSGGLFKSSSGAGYYEYYLPVLMLLCAGPVVRVGKVWNGNNIDVDKNTECYPTIPTSGPYTIDITPYVPAGYSFLEDGGVKFSDGTALQSVATSPAAGQYSVNTSGVYTFNSADAAGRTYTPLETGWSLVRGRWLFVYWDEFLGGWVSVTPDHASDPGVYYYYFESQWIYTYPADPVFEYPTYVNIKFYYGPSTLSQFNLTMYPGSNDITQDPIISYIDTNYPGQAIPYFGIAKAFSDALDLGKSSNMPSLQFEVTGLFPFGGGIDDAHPKDIISDLMTDSVRGAGIPAAAIANLDDYRNYCAANNLFLSYNYESQTAAGSIIDEILQTTNSAMVLSGTQFKIIPYGDTLITNNGYTYSPNMTAQYSLTDDDFVISGPDEQPVKCSRKNPADRFNTCTVEYLNRENSYNTDTYEAQDLALIQQYGRRPASTMTMHGIQSVDVAQTIASIYLQRNAYIGNTYTFRLDFSKVLLEPMDLIEISDSTLGLNGQLVRITEISEDEDYGFTVTAEEVVDAIASAIAHPAQISAGLGNNFNSKPGNINAPVIFEPPDLATQTGLELWISASGMNDGSPAFIWGGCEVWLSYDNNTYKRQAVVNLGARQGVLSADFPTNGSAFDTTHTLSVDLGMSKGDLIGATATDAEVFQTLCYCDGELIAYSSVNMTAANKYDLSTFIRRGCYDTTIGAHLSGASFVRLDDTTLKIPLSINDIGKQLYIKFLSFNKWGGGVQGLDEVTPYQYTIKGTGLTSPLPDVSAGTNYQGTQLFLTWVPVSDFRSPITYEIRMGASWDNSITVGESTGQSLPANSDGTYWIKAKYVYKGTTTAYSANATQVIVSGSSLVQNVVATHDEKALSWPGTKPSGYSIDGSGYLILDPGSVTFPATYTSTNVVDIGYLATCGVSANYDIEGVSINAGNLSAIPVLSTYGLLSGASSQYVDALIEIAISTDGSTYGPWQTWYSGSYTGWKFKLRVTVRSTDPNAQTIIQLRALNWTIDMPDRVDTGTVTTSAGGDTTVTYSPNAFQSSPPNVQLTASNMASGDYITIASSTSSSFSVSVRNAAGTRIVKDLNWLAQGY